MSRSISRRRRYIRAQYATNWLAEHGKLPEGVHTCRARVDWVSTPFFCTIDFTALWAQAPLSDRGRRLLPVPPESA